MQKSKWDASLKNTLPLHIPTELRKANLEECDIKEADEALQTQIPFSD